ncbi:HAD family hydrolase [Bacillus taeanensis]|uniref:Haloacid dehalogenase n=1 Tax=Bacillus taeanensis TaxID=273032 RepID=A0A366XUK7_9BACI|nr:HAD family hydrolase [Bacillus taeanensis]RBW69346.1 haloacid dehalogenase [Bacillus taeanensis]
MVYKLLALDVGGTLLRSNQRLDRQTKEAVEFVKRKGVYVTLVTGRHFTSAKKIAKSLKLETALITHNGAFTAASLDEPLYEKRMSSDKVYEITSILDKYDCHIRIQHERFSVGNRVRQQNGLIAKMTLGDPLFYPVTFVDSLTEHLRETPIAASKMDVYFKNSEEQEAAKRELAAVIKHLTLSNSEDVHLEIFEGNVSKIRGLRLLGEELGISLNEMVAVGESLHDKDMIEQVGLGVAMGNAHPEVKKAAKWVTRSNDQYGVSYMIKEVFRKQLRVQIRAR